MEGSGRYQTVALVSEKEKEITCRPSTQPKKQQHATSTTKKQKTKEQEEKRTPKNIEK